MFDETPRWTFTARYPIRPQWQSNVQLLPTRVLGQWFYLAREDGTVLWERRFRRPTEVVGISDGVVIATEGYFLGCYGISLETGELLWTSHANGWAGAIHRVLDFVPLLINDLRDAPQHVANGECICISGRVLDVHTGRQIRRMPYEEVQSYPKPRDDSQRLFEGVQIEPDAWLSIRNESTAQDTPLSEFAPIEDAFRRQFRLECRRDDRSVRWFRDLSSTGFHAAGRYTYRLRPPFLCFVAAEELPWKPHPRRRRFVLPKPTHFRLFALDLSNGEIVQSFRVDEAMLSECRLEDVDEYGLLISGNRRWVRYFVRA